MPPAIIAAGIGAAASIGGGLLASSASKKAANTASNTAQNTANANNALTQGIYNQNTANLRPFMDSGLQAQSALNGLLFGSPQPQAPAIAQVTPQGVGQGAMNALGGGFQAPMNISDVQNGNPFGMAGQEPSSFAGYQPQQNALAGPVNAQSAWDQFRNGTNYQFRLNEGLKGLNQGYAARGMIQSGAAMKGINNYAQNFASNELGNYMNMLAQQQQVGLSGANALAGVGTNMVGQMTANNNSAGTAAANAALMNGQNQANMYGGVANALGGLAGSFGSSFGGGSKPAAKPPNSVNSPWYIGF
jgi:hypothetical protein